MSPEGSDVTSLASCRSSECFVWHSMINTAGEEAMPMWRHISRPSCHIGASIRRDEISGGSGNILETDPLSPLRCLLLAPCTSNRRPAGSRLYRTFDKIGVWLNLNSQSIKTLCSKASTPHEIMIDPWCSWRYFALTFLISSMKDMYKGNNLSL